MNDFLFYSPTEFHFGRGAENAAGECCRALGARRAVICYGGGSAVRSGVLGRVEASLREAGVDYREMGGIKPNPTDDRVYEGIKLARSFGADLMLAVGGGSVIDTAKAIEAYETGAAKAETKGLAYGSLMLQMGDAGLAWSWTSAFFVSTTPLMGAFTSV